MKFVIDPNVLISALISDSVTRELILEMEGGILLSRFFGK